MRPICPPLVPILLLLAACDTGPVDQVPSGMWGGEAVLVVGGNVSNFSSGCLSTSLPGVIPLDADGRFSLPATLVWSAPVARTESGRVDGVLRQQRLTLTLVQPQTQVDFGTFVLRHGAPIPVDACLLR